MRRRERSRGPGARLMALLPAPSSQHSMKGITKIPSRFVPTVSSSASAAFPPTAWEPTNTSSGPLLEQHGLCFWASLW